MVIPQALPNLMDLDTLQTPPYLPSVEAQVERVSRSSPIQEWESTTDYMQLRELLTTLTKARTRFTPKDAQVRFAMALISGRDVTCVAATGFGKSLAYQMAVMLMPKQFGMIITPINALADDQVIVCKRYGLQAVNLTQDLVDANGEIMKDIIAGRYSLVYLAPEKLFEPQSPLTRLLKHGNGFASKIGFLMYDECHLVVDW